MPAPWTPPPELPVDDLTFSAKIDYVTLSRYLPRGKSPRFTGSIEKVAPSRRTGRGYSLCIHDPVRADLVALSSIMGTALVMGVEIAVDLRPKDLSDPVQACRLLEQTFVAVAARFRPEDQALWDHITRGAVKKVGDVPLSLERRMAKLGEEVIYGGRGEFMQAKLYLKTLDHGAELSLAERSVRMEITLRRGACMALGIQHVKDLIGYQYRKQFTTHFRIIDRPELRAAAKLAPAEKNRRTNRMVRAWSTAGVGKFAVGDRPREDELTDAKKRVAARSRAQLSLEHYKLVRDQGANAKIGAALMTLQRRMAT